MGAKEGAGKEGRWEGEEVEGVGGVSFFFCFYLQAWFSYHFAGLPVTSC